MIVGDIVKGFRFCGTPNGNDEAICESALIVREYLAGSAENPWEPGYEVTEYDLLCVCGEFGCLADHLERVNEAR